MAKTITRTLGFFGKELGEVFRQPSLVLGAVLGPFLIMLLFGLGYTGSRPPIRVELVVPPGSDAAISLSQYMSSLQGPMRIVAVSPDEQTARRALVNESADAVVVLPADVGSFVRNGTPAPVRVLYRQIDPVDENYLNYVVRLYLADINRQAATVLAQEGVGLAHDLRNSLEQARGDLDRLKVGIARGDQASAVPALEDLDAQVEAIDARFGTALQAAPALIGNESSAANRRPSGTLVGTLRQRLALLREAIISGAASTQQAVLLAALEGDLASLIDLADRVAALPVETVISPYTAEMTNLAPTPPTYVGFYGPHVLALIVQHIAITFVALSLVRERGLGAMELFRVSPVSPAEILTGKLLAYGLLAILVAGGLTWLMVVPFGSPLLSQPLYFGAGLLLLTAASLSYGLLISMVSHSERQAVQLSMLVLIGSVFFGGLLAPLSSFTWPTRAVAFGLPVTYGIEAFRSILLPVDGLRWLPLAALLAMTVTSGGVSLLLFRREFERG